ncbi:MAG: PadR family transcriptional regulator [Gemmatimonadaceae bacterium]
MPLKPVELHLLLALSHREQHGYGLVRAIEHDTDGAVALEPGNLYRVLKRLLEAGLVRESDYRAGDDGSEERRRYYALTSAGARELAEELNRLRAVVNSPAARALTRRFAS